MCNAILYGAICILQSAAHRAGGAIINDQLRITNILFIEIRFIVCQRGFIWRGHLLRNGKRVDVCAVHTAPLHRQVLKYRTECQYQVDFDWNWIYLLANCALKHARTYSRQGARNKEACGASRPLISRCPRQSTKNTRFSLLGSIKCKWARIGYSSNAELLWIQHFWEHRFTQGFAPWHKTHA